MVGQVRSMDSDDDMKVCFSTIHPGAPPEQRVTDCYSKFAKFGEEAGLA